jgi:hypothetical protein
VILPFKIIFSKHLKFKIMNMRQFWQQEAAFIRDTSAALSVVDVNSTSKNPKKNNKEVLGKSNFYIFGDSEKSADLAKCDILGMLDPISRRSVEITFEEDLNTRNYFKVLMEDNTDMVPGGTKFGQGYILLKNLINSTNIYLYKVERLIDDNGVKNLSKSKRVYDELSFTGQQQSRTYRKQYYVPFDILEHEDDLGYLNQKINSNRYLPNFSQIKNIDASSINFLVQRAKNSLKSLNLKHIKSQGRREEAPRNSGIAGEVTIASNGEWYFPRKDLDLIIPRIDIVFHELWECWERTDNYEPYGYSVMNEPFSNEEEVDFLFPGMSSSEKRTLLNNSGNFVFSGIGIDPTLSDKISGAHEKANEAARNDTWKSVKQPGTVKVRFVVESKSIPKGFCENRLTWNRAQEAQNEENIFIKDKNGVQYELRL